MKNFSIRLLVLVSWAVSFPGASAQVDPLAPSQQNPPTVLSGHLQSDELTGTATLNGDGKSITLYAVNNGKRALILDGDSAHVNGGTEKPLTVNQIISPPPKTDVPGDAVSVTASVGSLGTVPVVVDAEKRRKAKSTAYYGKDDKRRKLAERLFGKRVLFPGDSTRAEVFFAGGANQGQSLSIPVSSHPDGAKLGNLELNVAGADKK